MKKYAKYEYRYFFCSDSNSDTNNVKYAGYWYPSYSHIIYLLEYSDTGMVHSEPAGYRYSPFHLVYEPLRLGERTENICNFFIRSSVPCSCGQIGMIKTSKEATNVTPMNEFWWCPEPHQSPLSNKEWRPHAAWSNLSWFLPTELEKLMLRGLICFV